MFKKKALTMKFFLALVVIIATSIICFAGCTQKNSTNVNTQTLASTSFFDLSAQTIDGKTVSMNEYKGKYILVINTASKCGYTSQYKDLEKLYQQYKDRLVILGFPSNDFLWQEPGSNEKIKTFCEVNYKITFPMFAKISVKGKDKHPLYEWLTDPKLNGWNSTKPGWNFNKYLIDKEGKLIAHFGSKVEPLSQEITSLLK